MPTPKSVTKTKKDRGKVVVEYTESFDAAGYYIHELSRAALRDVGKFLKKAFNVSYYQHFKRRTGDAGRATKVKVIASPKTVYPRLQIGLPVGRVKGFYAYFQEFGTSRQPKLGLLEKAAKDNLATIVKIESQYLAHLSGEASRLESYIDEKKESDEEGDDI